MFKNASLTVSFKLPTIIPIPTYLVYDGFEKDLDAVTVYKRVKVLLTTDEPYIASFLSFLRACTTSRKQTKIQLMIARTHSWRPFRLLQTRGGFFGGEASILAVFQKNEKQNCG